MNCGQYIYIYKYTMIWEEEEPKKRRRRSTGTVLRTPRVKNARPVEMGGTSSRPKIGIQEKA